MIVLDEPETLRLVHYRAILPEVAIQADHSFHHGTSVWNSWAIIVSDGRDFEAGEFS